MPGTAVVVGASRGIGLELTRQLKDKGYKVFATCRTATPELAKIGAKVIESVDVAKDECMPVLASALNGEEIEVLICNAGILRLEPGNFEELPTHFNSMMETYNVNTIGPIRCVWALRNQLQKGSKVAIITSRVGSLADNGSGGMYGYRMSKTAVNMAGVNLAHQMKDKGVAVGLIHPGMVETDMTSSFGAKAGQGTCISTVDSASGIIARIEKDLSMDTTGHFWHQNGQELPW